MANSTFKNLIKGKYKLQKKQDAEKNDKYLNIGMIVNLELKNLVFFIIISIFVSGDHLTRQATYSLFFITF